jgi:polyhydroxyalkanoate synthesis regulator phasin
MPAKQIDGIISAQVEELQSNVSWLRFLVAGLAISSILLIIAVVILWFRTYDLQSKTTKIQTVFELKDGSVTNSKVAENAISFNQLSPSLQNQINQLNQITLNPVPGPAGANGSSGSNGSAGATGPPSVAIAQNGLNLSGSTIELGGNPLLHDTSIALNGSNFGFDATGGAGGNFIAEGTFDSGGGLPFLDGQGTKQIWFSKQGSSASGMVTSDTLDLNTVLGTSGLPVYSGDEWDIGNIGYLSANVGLDSAVTGLLSSSFGADNVVQGAGNTAIGMNNALSGLGNIAVGVNNLMTGGTPCPFGTCYLGSISMGTGAGSPCTLGTDANYIEAGGVFNVGACNHATGNGYAATIVGENNYVNQPNTYTLGNYNVMEGEDSFVLGSSNTLDCADLCGAIGQLNHVSGRGSMAIGFGLDVTNDNSLGISMNANNSASTYTISNPDTMAIMDMNLGINTTSPSYRVEVNDVSTDQTAAFTGTTQTCIVDTSGAGGWNCTSDERLKQNILDLSGSLDKIMQLRGVTYNFKSNPDSSPIAGFIAQEVQKVLPDLVGESKDGYLNLNKEGMIPYIVQAIKEQNGKIDDVNKAIADQGLQINSLSDELKALSTKVDQNTSEIESLKARVKQLEDNATKSSTTTTSTTTTP